MSPEDYRQLNQLFLAVMDLPQEERAAFLSQACEGDSRLRRRIEAMLEADAESDHLVDQLAHPSAVESDTEEITELPSGARLGHYRLTRQIGRGGMGAVYLAHDDKLDRQVALKVLPARFTSDTERVRRFQREARAASALNHPNILTIFDIGREGGSHYIATEFVEGRTLRALIGGAGVSLGEALDAVMQISSALSAAHQAGIIHRDIKPENVMVRPDGYVKVLDFGLAKLTERNSSSRDDDADVTQSSVFETQEGAVLGTVSYMSPEQARGLKVDTRTDLFSLGVVLYELITGVRPFNGSTRNHILVSILDHDPLPLSHHISNAPPELQRIVGRALSKDRDGRYQSSTELHADLRQLKDQLAVGAQIERRKASGGFRTEVEVAPRLALTTEAEVIHKTTGALSVLSELRPRKRNTALWLAGALVLLAAAAGLAKWFWAGKPKDPFARKQITRISVQGDLEGGAISPDGKYVVYVIHPPNQSRTVWVKQVNGGGNRQIADLGREHVVWSICVSPDSQLVYYTLDEPQGVTLYQVPLLGGQSPRPLPAKVTIIGNQQFSPDGKRVVISSKPKDSRGGVVKLVTLASGEEQTLFTTSDVIFEATAWSPDARTIGYVGRKLNDPAGNIFYIAERPIDGGPERIILSAQRIRLRGLAWLSNRRGLLTQGLNETSGTYQHYFVSYSGGALRAITEDADEYMGLWAAADGKTILSSRFDRLGSLQVAPLANPTQARQLSVGLNFFDHLAWKPDGQIVYDQIAEGGKNLWSVSSTGGAAQQLTEATGISQFPCVCADGRYIVFASNQSGSEQIWRINADGGSPLKLTTEGGTRPQCSPDGQWVIYENGRPPEQALWKISINGGVPAQLTPTGTGNPAISPDGGQIAFEYRDPVANDWRLAVMPFAGGAPTQTFAATTGNGVLRWSSDGRALLWVRGHATGYTNNLWLQSLSGGPPRSLFEIPVDLLFWFDLSPDGQQLAYISGSYALNLLLIRDLD